MISAINLNQTLIYKWFRVIIRDSFLIHSVSSWEFYRLTVQFEKTLFMGTLTSITVSVQRLNFVFSVASTVLNCKLTLSHERRICSSLRQRIYALKPFSLLSTLQCLGEIWKKNKVMTVICTHANYFREMLRSANSSA